MNDPVQSDNALGYIIEKINENSKWYDKAIVKAVLFREKESIYLYYSEINFKHKSENTLSEVINDYGSVVLVTWEISVNSLLKFVDSFSSGIVNIKHFMGVKIEGVFDNSLYHISSRSRIAGIHNDWPFWSIRFSAKQNVHFMKVYDQLTTPGNPPYPNLPTAAQHFLKLENSINMNTPIGIVLKVPDYRARIKTLEIAENEIVVVVEQKEIAKEELIVQIFAQRGMQNVFTSDDMMLNEDRIAKVKISFIPEIVHVYLLEKKTGSQIDTKAFGGWHTNMNDGVIIKTSKESIESMLVQGENELIEFKLNLDKEQNEFLETVVAFANTKGGTILLGVDDENIVRGHYDDFEKTERRIVGLVSGRCQPSINVEIESILVENRPVIIVNVKEGKDKPYLLAGKSGYKRVGKEDYVLTRLDLDDFYSKKNTQNHSIPGMM